jgi:hypothetical protein
MTSLSQGRTYNSSARASHRMASGPTAGFRTKVDLENNCIGLELDPNHEVKNVSLSQAGDICVLWSGEETEATLSFKPPEGARFDTFSVGWLVSDLHKSEPRSLPFRAVSPSGGQVKLTMSESRATYSCYFTVEQAGKLYGHDPKIYNEVPSGGPC